MANQLIAHLHPSHLDQVHWLVLDEHHQCIEGPFLGPLADLTSFAPQCQLTLLISSLALSLTTLQLPSNTSAQLRQAIPFALEEHVATDIEQLHFAFHPHANHQAVAIIQRDFMQNLIQQLAALKLYPQAIIPDIYALPIGEAQWHIVLTAEHALVRQNAYSGFAIERSLLNTFLTLSLNDSTSMPTDIQIINLSQSPITELELPKTEHNIPYNHIHRHDNAQAQNLLHYLATHLSHSPFTLNLLQGTFNLSLQNPLARRLIHIGIGLTCACILLFMSTQVLTYAYYQRQHQQLSQKIITAYQQFFPNATQVTSPKQRITQLLKETEQQSTGVLGLNWFAQLAPLLHTAQKTDASIKLSQVKIDPQQLSLHITAHQLESLSKLYEQFKTTGLNITQKNIQQHDKTISADFEVKP